MPAITFSGGLASGLDTQAIIDAILLAERRPATLLETRVAQRTGQVSAIKGLSALLVSLDIETERLSAPAAFDAFTVASTDEDVATGTASASSALGSYTLTVNALAQAQALVSQGYAAATDSVGAGTVSIQVGSEPATTVTVGAADATLQGLRDAINAADAGVTASVVNTGSGATPYRLILASKTTGAANQIAFTANLSGGTKPVFATTLSTPAKGAGFAGTATFTNVGPAVPGAFSGTTTPTSGGTYTGASTRTYTFTAQNGGTVGTDAITFSWSDGAGKTGTVSLAAGYAPGTAVAVENGLTVSFSAGTVVASDAFTVAATGRGTYTGTKNKTFTFTVTTGGTIGTDAIAIGWTDGAGGSGTINVPSGYTLRSQIAVAEGVVVAFDGGTLVAGDAFTIATTSPILQAAQDASITLGSAAGGGNPITVTSDANTFDDLVEGLSVTLHSVSATPVTLDVAQDSEGIEEGIRTFVDRFNSVRDYLATQLTFDPEAGTKGPLFGDPVLLRVDGAMRRIASSRVPGLSGGYTALSSIGIRSDATGRLTIDESELADAVQGDLESVRRLFATIGAARDDDVSFVAGGSARPSTTSADPAVAADGYAVVITRAAERGRIAGGEIADPASTPITLNATNNVVRVRVNGILGSEVVLTPGTYTSGSALAAEIESSLNADPALSPNRVSVSWVSTGAGVGRFEVETAEYGSGASVAIESTAASAWTGALGFAEGQMGLVDSGADVAGTIGGEEAHGEGQILVGGPEEPEDPGAWDTLGLRLLVTLTPAQLAAQGGAQGSVTLSAGVGALFTQEIERLTDATDGLLSERERTVNRQIDSLEDQIDRIDARLEKRRRLLEEQFSRLEAAVASLQAQSSFLSGQLAGLLGGSTTRTSTGR